MSAPEAVVGVGADLLADAVEAQAVPVTRVDWRPPMEGTEADLATVAADPRRPDANARALAAMLGVTATLVDVVPASEALGLEPGQFLHAGPPIEWDRASGPLRGALMGGAALEGLVEDPEDAVALFEAGHVRFAGALPPPLDGRPDGRRGHAEHVAVGPRGRRQRAAYVLLAQRGARQGAAVRRLRPRGADPAALDGRRARPAAPEGGRDATGPVDVTGILTQMLQMGDEAHNRNRAGTLMLLRDLSPAMVTSGVRHRGRRRGAALHRRQRPLLPQPRRCRRASSRWTRRAASRARRWSSRWPATAPTSASRSPAPATSGSPGPAQLADGLFLGDYGPDDANPDIGDSAITETAGIGGFAMATAPAIVRFVGGSVPDALATTRRMHEITLGENPRWSVPVLEFQGTPTGIDVTKVCRTGILPQINTGMAGKVAGVGQVGAGLVTPPAEIFPKALARLAQLTPSNPV